MRYIQRFTLLFIAVLWLHDIDAALAQPYSLRAGAISAGTATSNGTLHAVQSTVGQVAHGRSGTSRYSLGGGFWSQARPAAGPLAVPTPMADTSVTDEDTAVTLDVLANDTDPAGGTLTLTAFSEPDHGTVEQVGANLIYTPEADFNGEDAFTYTVINEEGGRAIADVTITVAPVNDAPVFTSTPVTGVAAGQAYRYTAIAADVDGDALVISATTLPAWLRLTDHGDGTATLDGTTVSADAGAYAVTVTASDGQVTIEQAYTVTIIVGAPAVPTPAAPQDGAADVSETVRLAWHAVAGATSYDLQLDTAADFSGTLIEQKGVTDTTFTVSGLDASVTYFWRVRAVNAAGASVFSEVFRFTTATNVAVEEAEVPGRFVLEQNYPNPFNPTTTIAYELPTTAPVRLVVYDVFGREVARLVEATQGTGRHEVRFEASGLASGAYLYRIDAGSWSQTKQFVLLK